MERRYRVPNKAVEKLDVTFQKCGLEQVQRMENVCVNRCGI
jgi:hypothetical protein